jgi:hypothetical protein
MSMDLIDHLPPALYPFLTRPAATPTLDRPDLVKLLPKRSNSGHLIQDLAGNIYSFAKSKSYQILFATMGTALYS